MFEYREQIDNHSNPKMRKEQMYDVQSNLYAPIEKADVLTFHIIEMLMSWSSERVQPVSELLSGFNSSYVFSEFSNCI